MKSTTAARSVLPLLTHAYTGLVKLACKTVLIEGAYIWEGLYIDGLFGKSGTEMLKPDEMGFRGAVSRTFVHVTKELERVLKSKNDWKNTVIYEVEERAEDEGGIRNGVDITFLEMQRASLRMYPPLTTFQVKRTYTSRIPMEQLGRKAREHYGNDTRAVSVTFIVLEPLFSPTPHLPELEPSEKIWDAVRLVDVDTVVRWLENNPSVNLETTHPDYKWVCFIPPRGLVTWKIVSLRINSEKEKGSDDSFRRNILVK